MTMGHDTFEARSITARRGRRIVLNRTSLRVQEGEVLSLLGANGAGKSTFLSVLADELKLVPSPHGRDAILINERPLHTLSAVDQARSRAVLPQKPSLGFDLEVAEVLEMGTYPFPELSAEEAGHLIRDVLALAGIAPLMRRRYIELSGGEQQRVQFARVALQVLANRGADPRGRYMLLDEPTASLDPLHQQSLMKTLVHMARSERIGVLVILHDVNLAARWSDRIALLSQNEIVACDTPPRVLTAANLKRVYGVDAHVMPHPRIPDTPLVVFD